MSTHLRSKRHNAILRHPETSRSYERSATVAVAGVPTSVTGAELVVTDPDRPAGALVADAHVLLRTLGGGDGREVNHLQHGTLVAWGKERDTSLFTTRWPTDSYTWVLSYFKTTHNLFAKHYL